MDDTNEELTIKFLRTFYTYCTKRNFVNFHFYYIIQLLQVSNLS